MYSNTSNIRVIWFNVYLLYIEFFNWKKVNFGTCPVSRFVSVPSVLPESDLLCVLQMMRRLLRNIEVLYEHIFCACCGQWLTIDTPGTWKMFLFLFIFGHIPMMIDFAHAT